MKLNILDPIPVAEVPKNSYVVEIKAMQGDADGYRHFSVGPFVKGEQEAALQSLLETLKRMETGYSYDTGYKEVLGFEQWFGEVDSVEDLHKWFPELLALHDEAVHKEIIEHSEEHGIEWNDDKFSDGPERLDKFNVVYYDETGTKRKVEVVW